MILRRIVVFAAVILSGSAFSAQVPQRSTPDRLDEMLGAWQSDTVAGISVSYACERSPEGRALVCDEAVSRPVGIERVVGLYIADSLPDRYRYIEAPAGGELPPPMRVIIEEHVWIFGGDRVASDGGYHRTVHDFTGGAGRFSWRKEFSRDGVHWTVERRGTVRQRRPLVPAADVRH